jgi:hypothetical protein
MITGVKTVGGSRGFHTCFLCGRRAEEAESAGKKQDKTMLGKRTTQELTALLFYCTIEPIDFLRQPRTIYV